MATYKKTIRIDRRNKRREHLAGVALIVTSGVAFIGWLYAASPAMRSAWHLVF